MNKQLLIAGFGGQGILFSGKFLAYSGLLEGLEVSWLPSYGPEMRGGTAHCSIILSETPVGSPIVNNPDVLVAMNLPSLEKYEEATVSGGQIFYDSSLIDRKVERTDVEVYPIPATKMASDNNLPGLANMIMVGYLLKKSGVLPYECVDAGLGKVVSAKRQALLESNKQAIALGYSYEEA